MAVTTLGRNQRREGIPDILDAIAALSSDAVPTPPVLARAMLDLLPAEVWTDPTLKWFDPAVKSGSILREVAARLMDGLSEWESDVEKRANHILRNMIFGVGITRLHTEMGRRSVYVSRDATGPKSVVYFDTSEGNIPFIESQHDFPTNKAGRVNGNCAICGASPGIERGRDRENYAYAFIHEKSFIERLKGMKFDVIVTNPPYQVGLDDNTRSKPIYHRFIDNAMTLEPKYISMIVPSRWFTGGLGLDEFRDKMIADRRLSKVVDNPKVFDCFPGVEIQGGVNYFLWDRDHDGDCEFSTRIDGVTYSTEIRDLRKGDGVLVRDNRAVRIVDKVREYKYPSLETTCSPTLPFNIRDNEATRTEERDGDVPVVHGRYIGFVQRSDVTKNSEWIDRYKVLLPMAYNGGQAVDGDILRVTVIGAPIAVAPGSICTLTYMVAAMFDTAKETENFANYLTTKFARFLILPRKATQHVTPDRLRFVPMLDMTRAWTDEELYVHFGLTQDERNYIEATIKPRSVNLSLDSPTPATHLPGGSKFQPAGKRAAKSVPYENQE